MASAAAAAAARNGRPENVRACAEASLRRLGVDVIDLYYQHRVDPKVPIEDTVGRDGRAGGRGQGRATSGCRRPAPTSLRRAHAVHPIAALQSEWSLWTRDIERRGAGDGPRARHRHRAVQPAGPRLPHRRDHQPRRLRRGRLPPRQPALPGRGVRGATCGWSTRSGSSPPRRGRPRRSSRWPGCSPRARTSCRSRAPSGCLPGGERGGRRASSSPPTTWPAWNR